MTSEQTRLEQGRRAIDGDYHELRCAECYGALEFHQPDPDSPYRILATCDHCDCWYLLNLLAGWMLLLPNGDP
jgi:hypothetical protein